MSDGFSEIIAASKVRAVFVIAVPLAYPFLIAAGLAYSGRNPADYTQLLANGELSLAREALGWVCVIVFSVLYIPLALEALRARPFIGTSPAALSLPSGETIAISGIEAIELRRGFWQRFLVVRSVKSEVRTRVTLGRGLLADMRRALEADPHLRGVKIA